MRWELPRELLWATIAGLAITVAVLWPSKYPYSQAPNVHSEQQAKDGVGRQDSAGHSKAPQENAGRDQQEKHRAEHASETTVLGVKPGEWLIGIVTWMLWLATVGLVRGAEKTAERQLRAYVGIDRITATVMKIGQIPEIRIRIKNSGQTPAYSVKHGYAYGFKPPDRPDHEFRADPSANSGTTIAANMKISMTDASPVVGPLTQKRIDAIKSGTLIFYVWGETNYVDVFGNKRTTRYKFVFDADTGVREGLMYAALDGHYAD